MARLHVIEDGEFGRGRQNDSSSSRESSPRRPQKRSFSPTSDDGDLVIPPIADDDTPPPPERPLLRQPVAFAWNNSLPSLTTAPVDLNTYQVSIPNVTSSSNTAFLPGQEVPSLALPAPKIKGSRTKKADGAAAKKRRTVEYSGQTGRFRLNAYDPTPSTSPPLHQGQGPYSSMYRGTAATDRSFNTASPTLTLSSGGGYGGSVPPTPAPAPDVSSGSKAPSQHTSRRSKQTEARVKPSAGREKSSDVNAKSSNKGKGRRKTSAAANNMPSASSNVASPSHNAGGGRYYRHDYGSNTYGLDAQHSPGSSAQSPFPEPGVPAPAGSSVTDSGARRVVRPVRMVTLLIQDLRSGVADHQLAEVKIHLRPADDPEDGFWADAKELSEQLQSSPARIDGPAKAYTLRGKYRQFFLRVSAENKDEFISANLVVKPDRTLDIVVEVLPDPGILPEPPKIPRELRSPSPGSLSSSPGATGKQIFYDASASGRRDYTFSDDRCSQQSPSAWSHGHTVSLRSSTSYTGYPSYESPRAQETRVGKEMREYESSGSDLDDDEANEYILKAMDSIIQKDSGWEDFFKAKAAPQRVSEVLKQYRFIQRMMDLWVGRKPFGRTRQAIEAKHITQALQIMDAKYSSNCTETLTLLALYGPQGQHFEDSRIVAMVNDSSDPERNAQPIKRMLRLLREIDELWKREHPLGTGSPDSASSHGTSER